MPRPEELRLGGRPGEGGEALLAPRGAEPMGPQRRGTELAAGAGHGGHRDTGDGRLLWGWP